MARVFVVISFWMLEPVRIVSIELSQAGTGLAAASINKSAGRTAACLKLLLIAPSTPGSEFAGSGFWPVELCGGEALKSARASAENRCLNVPWQFFIGAAGFFRSGRGFEETGIFEHGAWCSAREFDEFFVMLSGAVAVTLADGS